MKLSIVLVLFTVIGQTAYAASNPILLKNFRELYASYESAMGVDGSDKDLRDLLQLNVDRLPKVGIPEELSSPMVLASTEISGAFCRKAIEREMKITPGERLLFGSVNFERGPDQFTDFLKGKLVDNLSDIFWQRAARADEKAALFLVLTDAPQNNASAKAETPKALQVFCTAFATSLAFLTK